MNYTVEGLLTDSAIDDNLLGLKNKSFIELSDYSPAQRLAVIQQTIKNNQTNGNPDACDSLRGKTLVPIFDKQSTRTYASTVSAFQKLGGNIINIDSSKSQIANGEPIKDTARTLGNYADIIVARLSSQEDLQEYKRNFKNYRRFNLPVISGMTDFQQDRKSVV